MKLLATLVTLVLTAATVDACTEHLHGTHTGSHNNHHVKVARRANAGGKCDRHHSPKTSAPTHATVAKVGTHAKTAAKASAKVLNVDNSHAGSCSDKAAGKISAAGGPNGSQKYLNCGITSSGWNPPYISVDTVEAVDLNSARWTAFASCSDEAIGLFYKYGGKHNIPPILIASFAMQESGCNPNTVGGAGEQGIMQITRDKCDGRSDVECRELDYNIGTGAAYFASQLKANDGNLVVTVGGYNGWFEGMTYYDATKAASTNCCRCQNNLDYLQQFFNGWLQGYNAYSSPITLGTYFNLDDCSEQ